MLCSFYRFCTFLDYYFPAGDHRKPRNLAETGLYLCEDQTVQCYFCFEIKTTISDLEASGYLDVENGTGKLEKWHSEMSAYCPLLKEGYARNTYNVTLEQQHGVQLEYMDTNF
jgi:hypothetical protein